MKHVAHDVPPALEPDDGSQFRPGYGRGGVPWLLLAFYVAFLAFFTWYALEYQLPDFLQQGPGRAPPSATTAQ